ncbi:hypothetical protein Tco_0718815 [Tanacetum coccineum]
MSQPANDEFSQHLSDDEESNLKMHQILMCNDDGRYLRNGNSKKRISTRKDGTMEYFMDMDDAVRDLGSHSRTRRAKKRDMTDFNSYFLNWKLMGVWEVSTEAANHKFLRLDLTPSSTNIPEKEVLAGFPMKECTAKGTHDGKKKRDSLYQHQEAGKQEKNQMGLLTMDDGIISNVPPEVYVSTPITTNDEPNEMSKSRLEVTNEKDVSAPKSKEVEPSCVSHIKTPRQPLKDNETHKVNRKNWNDMMERELGEGYSFTKKKCFVSGSLSHLIKDYDYYEKKMAREAEVRRVVNTGNREAKPVWKNANRINHSNKFVPRSVQINTGRTNVNAVRPKVNAVSSNINTVRSRQPVPNKTSNSLSPKRPQMNQINQRRDFSKPHSSVRRPFAKTTAQMSHSNAVMGNWGSAIKTSASYNWRNSRPNFNYNSGPTFIRTVNAKGPQGRPKPVKAWIFDSGCSGHMTGNKDQLEDFEEFNGGSVTFGGSKGYISGKGKIRVGNLDFDSVSFVKELGHFNLFSISQICDKQHKVLFTETECLVVSSDFKMPDENQILLKVPRHHNMYSFDMKTPTPAKGFACLIAKATSDESKLWHRRYSLVCFGKFDGKSDEGFLGHLPKSKIKKIREQDPTARGIRFFSTDTLEDNPKIQAFRRELNNGVQKVNTSSYHDDSPMPELEIFHKSETRIFDEASYDEEGVITDFNSLPTEIEQSAEKSGAHDLSSYIQKRKETSQRSDSIVFEFACFLSKDRNLEKDCLKLFKMDSIGSSHAKNNVTDSSTTSMGFSCRSTSWNEGDWVQMVYKNKEMKEGIAAITPMETKVPLTKDEEAIDVDITLDKIQDRVSLMLTPKTFSSQCCQEKSSKYLNVKRTNLGLEIHNLEELESNFLDKDLSHCNAEHGCVQMKGSLETDLKQTKLTMGNALVKLVKKVKKLEGSLTRRKMVLSDSEEEEPEAQERKSQDDPLDSLVQGLVTPSTTRVNASGEEQVEDINKGRRYKRRKETKGKKVVSSLVFQEEVDTGAKEVNTAEGVNTGSIKISTVSEQVSTSSAKRSIPSPDKGQRVGKAPMISEETPKKSKEQILQEEASLTEAIQY